MCGALVFKPSGVSGGVTGDAVAKSRDDWSGLKRHGVVRRFLPSGSGEGRLCDRI